MINEIVFDYNFAVLTSEELLIINGGNVFGEVCKTVTQITGGAIIGSAASAIGTPAAGYVAGTGSFTLIGKIWDAAFK